MLIRTGQVEIEVDSLDRAIRRVHALAAQMGGFLGGSVIEAGQDQRRTAKLELKVPAERYEGILSALEGIGKIRNATTTSQDVGKEYVDVEARMANAQRLEDRLINLLGRRTGKLQDVLAVEHELARVREEIERYEGRVRYLKSQVAISTLVVDLREPTPIIGDPGSNVVVNAFKEAYRNGVSVIAASIQVAGGLLPLFLLALAVVVLVRRWLRRPRAARGTA